MKIAVTSQNRKDVTAHAGRCRRFWIFAVEEERIAGREMRELSIEETFHESSHDAPHPLDDIDVFITGGMGPGLAGRLARKGIEGVVTKEADPETAVTRYLDGTLDREPAVGEQHH